MSAVAAPSAGGSGASGTKAPNKKALAKARTAFEARRQAALRAVLWSADGSPRDLLAELVAFRTIKPSGGGDDGALTLSFSAPTDASWSPDIERFVFDLTKTNMEAVYAAAGGSWSWNSTKKRGELFSEDTRYVLCRAADGALVGFLAFRLEFDNDYEVLYVYELQIAEAARRRGLGRHLMLVAELMARKNGMQWVMLTVLKNNEAAVDFYRRRMKYDIDESSPSESGEERPYEILSKIVYPDAVKLKGRIADEFSEGNIPSEELLSAPGATAKAPAASPPKPTGP